MDPVTRPVTRMAGAGSIPKSPRQNRSPSRNSPTAERWTSATSSNEAIASPKPDCAICLGKLKNECFTDSCLHQFCFCCLVKWSKVRLTAWRCSGWGLQHGRVQGKAYSMAVFMVRLTAWQCSGWGLCLAKPNVVETNNEGESVGCRLSFVICCCPWSLFAEGLCPASHAVGLGSDLGLRLIGLVDILCGLESWRGMSG